MRHFIFILLSLYCFAARSQHFEGGSVTGIAGSQIDGDNRRGYFKFGFNLGFYVRRHITDESSWQMEIKYTGKGAHSFDSINLYDVRLHYVEIPVSYIYQFNPKYYFQIGASAGYLFKGVYNGYSLASGSYYDNYDITSALNKIDICGLVGAGYYINKNLVVNLRLSRSLTPLYTVTGGAAVRTWDRSTYNNTLAIALYYRMGN